jgi:DNA-binding transcriptional LysR family regulator
MPFRVATRPGSPEDAGGEASRRHAIPKATLSYRLRRLEEDLGTELFDRSGRKLVPTPSGRLFAVHAEAIARVCRQAEEAMAGLPAPR